MEAVSKSPLAVLQLDPATKAKAQIGTDLNRLILTVNQVVPGGAALDQILHKLQEVRVLAYANFDTEPSPPTRRILR